MRYRLLALDVDGTLTDGKVYICGNGDEFKVFDIQDGLGISLFRKSGGKVALISGRFSRATELRAKELGVDYLVNGTSGKVVVLKKIAENLHLSSHEVIYAGDDINDIECVSWAGLGVAVNNAKPELKQAADFVTEHNGGSGAIREIVDKVLNVSAEEGSQ